MRFLLGALLGGLTGILYDAAAFFLIRNICTDQAAAIASRFCSVVTRWPIYQSYPIAQLDHFVSKQLLLGIPSFATFQVSTFTLHIDMVNTILIFAIIGAILAMLKPEWRPVKLMEYALLLFLLISLVFYLGSLSMCALLKTIFGSDVRFFACDPPSAGWKW